MNRRRFLGIAFFGALPLISGCINDPGANGGILELFENSAPPDATVVDSTDERVADLDPLQEGFQDLVARTETVTEVRVSEDEYDAVAGVLSDLPWYDRADHDGTHLSGIYFRHDDTEIAVVLTPFCVDSPIRSAYSERGEYGWGGCYDEDGW